MGEKLNAKIDLIKLAEVKTITKLSTSSIYAMMAADTFPRPVKTGKRSVCWVLQEVQAWGADLVAKRDGASDGRV